MRKFQFSLRTLVVSVLALSGLLLLSAWHFDWGHRAVEEVPKLNGLTLAEVEKRLGPTGYQTQLRLSECHDEMRWPLRRHYPMEQPGNADVVVKEMKWEFHACYLTIWFHQVNGEWVVLETLRYRKGVVF